jgi:hypothetical protein
MEHKEYEKEIRRLESELSHLDSKTTISEPLQPRKIGLTSYLPYALISGIMFVLLILVKPKRVLKIIVVEEIPQMVVDKGKLIIWWLILSVAGSIGYIVWKKMGPSRAP